MDLKKELAEQSSQMQSSPQAKLTKGMAIADLIKALEPEIKKALSSFLTPERFTRMALSALNNTPQLKECSPISFLAALMNAAQLGLEPNTPLGQAYLIPFQNKGKLECQLQIGFKGMLELIYRNKNVQMIQAHCVYEKDHFSFAYGLEPRLEHIPCQDVDGRGKMVSVYALYKLTNGGFGFEVMGKGAVDAHAEKYARAFHSEYSPWKTEYESMAKKTVIKRLLKYAPLKTDLIRAVSNDNTVKTTLAEDMSEVANEAVYEEAEEGEEGTAVEGPFPDSSGHSARKKRKQERKMDDV